MLLWLRKSLRRFGVVWLLNRFYSLVFLAMFFSYSVLYLATWVIIPAWGPSWVYWVSFFGRKVAPLFLLSGFFALGVFGLKGKVSRFLDGSSRVFLFFVVGVVVFLLFGYVVGVQFEAFTGGGNWNYIPVFEYGLFLVFGYRFVGGRLGGGFYPFMLLSFALFAAGFLYEFPVIFKAELYQPFHIMHPLFVSPNIISLVAFSIFLYFNRVKVGFLQVASFTVFFGYSILIFLFALNPAYYAFHLPLGYAYRSVGWYVMEGWLPRLPALFFVTSMVCGVKI